MVKKGIRLPAARIRLPMEHAWPMQYVCIGEEMYYTLGAQPSESHR